MTTTYSLHLLRPLPWRTGNTTPRGFSTQPNLRRIHFLWHADR
jgi:hypothetical protein